MGSSEGSLALAIMKWGVHFNLAFSSIHTFWALLIIHNGPSVSPYKLAFLGRLQLGDSYSVQNREVQQQRDGGLQIETAAGILMASIFAFFILTYTVFLQCWWRCQRSRERRRRPEKAEAEKGDASLEKEVAAAGEGCSCFAQAMFSTWEQVDMDKLLAERTCNVSR